MTLEQAYKAGMKDALWLYAWWKDGEQYVGCGRRTLAEATDSVERLTSSEILEFTGGAAVLKEMQQRDS